MSSPYMRLGSQERYERLRPRLDEIRSMCQRDNCFSWTTDDYQRDIIEFIIDTARDGAGVIEVGCFKGGLSCLLAEVCHSLGSPFFTMDVDPAAVATTSRMLAQLGLDGHSLVFQGTLKDFAANTRLAKAPALIILDGDHRYEAVVEDIEWTYRLNERPYAAAFHDYSLRHPTSGEAVDRAIADSFGPEVAPKLIGAQIRAEGVYPTQERPSPDGHYWLVPGSEGAIVVLPETLARSGSNRERPDRPSPTSKK